jgi:hypothetical protein
MIFSACKEKCKQMEYDIQLTGKQIKKWQFWAVGSYAIKNAIMAGADAF